MGSATIHLVSFCDKIIETTVTDKVAVAEAWVTNILCKHMGQKMIVGLDCKYNPHPILSMTNKIATLQICVDTKCLILQLFHMHNIPLSITNFFINPNITFYGVEVDENASKLRSEYGLECSNKVDIRAMVKIRFPVSYRRNPSLKGIAYGVTGLTMRKRKKFGKCDWEFRVLDEELIEFACVDAYASYMIAHKLLNQR